MSARAPAPAASLQGSSSTRVDLAKKALVMGGRAAIGVVCALAGAAAANAVGTGVLAGIATGALAVTASAATTAAGVVLGNAITTTETSPQFIAPPLVAAYIAAQKTTEGALQALGTIAGASAAVTPAIVVTFLTVNSINSRAADKAFIIQAMLAAATATGTFASSAAAAAAGRVTQLAAWAAGCAVTVTSTKIATHLFPKRLPWIGAVSG